MYSSDGLFHHSQECYFGVYFLRCKATRKINIKITLECTQIQFVTRVHTLFDFLHDKINPYMMRKTTIFTRCPCVSLARFSFCWWRHNQLWMTSQWLDNYDTIMWIMISISLDIDFIRTNIHGRSCKKLFHLILNQAYHFLSMLVFKFIHVSKRGACCIWLLTPGIWVQVLLLRGMHW